VVSSLYPPYLPELFLYIYLMSFLRFCYSDFRQFFKKYFKIFNFIYKYVDLTVFVFLEVKIRSLKLTLYILIKDGYTYKNTV